MEALRQYVISVVAAAMLCGIVVRLFPNGSGKQVGKLICGLNDALSTLHRMIEKQKNSFHRAGAADFGCVCADEK